MLLCFSLTTDVQTNRHLYSVQCTLAIQHFCFPIDFIFMSNNCQVLLCCCHCCCGSKRLTTNYVIIGVPSLCFALHDGVSCTRIRIVHCPGFFLAFFWTVVNMALSFLLVAKTFILLSFFSQGQRNK